MKRFEIFFSVLLIPVDLVCLALAFVLSYRLRDDFGFLPAETVGSLANRLNYTPGGGILLPFDRYLHYLAFILPAMLVIFALVGLYSLRSNASWLRRLAHIFIGVSVGEFFILLLFLLKKDFFIPRSTFVYSWLLCTVLVVFGRLLVEGVQRWLRFYDLTVIRVAVIGRNAAAATVVGKLSGGRSSLYRIVLQCESDEVDAVIKNLKKYEIDAIIVAGGNYSNEDLIAVRNCALEIHASFSFVPALLTELQSTFDVQSLAGLPVIEVRPTPLDGWGRVVKRLFDIVGSLVLIVLFSPVYLVLALWIKADDPEGPLIYKHPRVGKNGKQIYTWKFRSFKWKYCTHVGGSHGGDDHFAALLKANPELAKEWRETQKLKNDPRISKPGRFIRKTHLDELPEFFNVLSGRLSLVGPRPILKEEISRFGDKARILFSVKPGVTGPWQVEGGNELSYDRRVELNAYYIEHWNLLLDIVILFKTFWMMLMPGKKSTTY